jgi:hypothetical protein
MRIEEDFKFQARYLIDTKPGWPEHGEVVVRALSPAMPLESTTGDYQNLRFYPEKGSSWFGEFPISERNIDGALCSTPDPDVVFVQSGWRVYRVNVIEKSALALPKYPVIQIKPDPYRDVIWLVGFGDVEAVASSGEFVWASNQFALDSLRILEIRSNSAFIETFEGTSIIRREIPLRAGQITETPPWI